MSGKPSETVTFRCAQAVQLISDAKTKTKTV
jgi:hypothetical protein